MEKTNQTTTNNQKTAGIQPVQSPAKSVSGLTKYVSKKQIAVIGILFSLIVILFIVAMIMKKTSPGQTAKTSSGNGFEDVSQSTVQLSSSSPEKTVATFLDLVAQNNYEQSQDLISAKADTQSFEDTFGESENSSFYGKDFTFEIHNIQTEVPGTISYVTVEIVREGQSETHFFTLLKDRNTNIWQLVKNEVFSPVSLEPQE